MRRPPTSGLRPFASIPRVLNPRPWLFVLGALAPWWPVVANAALTSAQYRLEPTLLSGGAGLSASTDYAAFSGIVGPTTGSASSASYSVQYGFFPGATPLEVTGRHIFYNQSAWDGNNAAANASDDAAIAPDKTALFPGGTAGVVNYTSFSRGINGLMVDLPNGAAPTLSDFIFKKGNTATPGSWGGAPNPTHITVRAGAGVGGADRVTLLWANNLIQKEWLEVTVRATPRTGIATPDTFYFGNSIGESGVGNSSTRFSVTSVDVLFAINNPVSTGAAITNPADHNRDKRVTSVDALLSINHSAVGTAALIRLVLGAGDSAVRNASSPGVALASTAETEPISTGFLGRPEIVEDREQLWFFQPLGEDAILEHGTDLGSGQWEPVPSEWLVPQGDGFFQVSLPLDAAHRFVRWRTKAANTTD
jgi:hypothetical protein